MFNTQKAAYPSALVLSAITLVTFVLAMTAIPIPGCFVPGTALNTRTWIRYPNNRVTLSGWLIAYGHANISKNSRQ